jgi:SAM-dependent methyltransferase
MAFKDHFSTQAGTYARARPGYPAALFDWLAAQAPARRLAWDAGCGNGQAAQALAEYFERVVATDPSAAQLEHAPPHPRIDYREEPAETPSLPAGRVDLITVAQALHWFDLERFHEAANRVLAPGGVIAEWSYALCEVDPGVDRVFMRLYDGVLGAYWPAERRHVETGYADLPFPFRRLEAPTFAMVCRWTLPQYLDYLRSWSASARYRAAHGEDPVSLLAGALAAAWGDPRAAREVRWPLALRVGIAD